MNFNQSSIIRTFTLSLIFGLAACDSTSETFNTPTEVTEVKTTTEEIDPDSEGFISAETLLGFMKENVAPPIFDVRAIASFEESHILNATSLPYGNYTDEDVVKAAGSNKSQLLVTYCGCPRHLSGLVAQDLRDKGYTDVRSLYEGYWYWVDSDYPIVKNTESVRTALQFKGQVVSNQSPVQGQEIFIRNMRNGQLEATRTDQSGRFETGFEILNFQSTDQFAVTLHSPKSKIQALVGGHPEDTLNLLVQLN